MSQKLGTLIKRNEIRNYLTNPMESANIWRNLSYLDFINKLIYWWPVARKKYIICFNTLDTVF